MSRISGRPLSLLDHSELPWSVRVLLHRQKVEDDTLMPHNNARRRNLPVTTDRKMPCDSELAGMLRFAHEHAQAIDGNLEERDED